MKRRTVLSAIGGGVASMGAGYMALKGSMEKREPDFHPANNALGEKKTEEKYEYGEQTIYHFEIESGAYAVRPYRLERRHVGIGLGVSTMDNPIEAFVLTDEQLEHYKNRDSFDAVASIQSELYEKEDEPGYGERDEPGAYNIVVDNTPEGNVEPKGLVDGFVYVWSES